MDIMGILMLHQVHFSSREYGVAFSILQSSELGVAFSIVEGNVASFYSSKLIRFVAFFLVRFLSFLLHRSFRTFPACCCIFERHFFYNVAILSSQRFRTGKATFKDSDYGVPIGQ